MMTKESIAEFRRLATEQLKDKPKALLLSAALESMVMKEVIAKEYAAAREYLIELEAFAKAQAERLAEVGANIDPTRHEALKSKAKVFSAALEWTADNAMSIVGQSIRDVTLAERQQQATKASHKKTNEGKAQVIAAWQSGKFKSKNICAEEEHEAAGVTFGVARGWLKGI